MPRIFDTRRYGEVTNMLLDRSTIGVTPVVGGGATILMYSDRNAVTIIAYDAPRKTLIAQRDHIVRTDSRGMCETQDYAYSQNPQGQLYHARLRKDGRWITREGWTVLIGTREEWYDFSR